MSGVVAANLQTSDVLDLALIPRTPVIIPFTVFTVNSGSFAFTSSGDGTFTMPYDGTYQITLTARILNSAEEKSNPAKLIAFMAYSWTSIVNTATVFSLQSASNSTCVASFPVMAYKAGTEITANLETETDTTSLSLTAPIDTEYAPAELSIQLIR